MNYIDREQIILFSIYNYIVFKLGSIIRKNNTTYYKSNTKFRKIIKQKEISLLLMIFNL